jgi:hypothetical protein
MSAHRGDSRGRESVKMLPRGADPVDRSELDDDPDFPIIRYDALPRNGMRLGSDVGDTFCVGKELAVKIGVPVTSGRSELGSKFIEREGRTPFPTNSFRN